MEIKINVEPEDIPTDSKWRKVAEAPTGIEALVVMANEFGGGPQYIPAIEYFLALGKSKPTPTE